jgi:hypothetical protein
MNTLTTTLAKSIYMKKENQPMQQAFRLSPVAHGCQLLCALICASTLGAMSSSAIAKGFEALDASPIPASTASTPMPVGKIGGVDYSANSQVAKVIVEVEKDGLPADGVNSNTITVKALDSNGKTVLGRVIVTIEHSAGRVKLDGARTDEMGPGAKDLDKVTPGIQMVIDGGTGTFKLLAPSAPIDVKLRITAGGATAEGTISYMPELREMLAIGLIEGIIAVNKNSSNSIVPARIDDGFERELRNWSREFSNGKGTAAARVAFFLQGQIKGDVLLTMAVDSDKDLKDRLYRDTDPNKFYPVYGDASIVGFAARSRDRVYVRLDSGKSYALYGDFSTGDGFNQMGGGGATANIKSRNLGAYSRTSTGLRLHKEEPGYFVNGFATYDSLKQLVEEYRANGTSGPFAVSSKSAVAATEKVEIITRDRNAVDRVISVVPQVRLIDYTFEPFSGRILFKAPIGSVDINGNPQSIRITYEVEQGGQNFATFGVDGQVKLGSAVEVGAAVIRDQNPLSPYNLNSANVTAKINEKSRIVLEVAQSNSTRYNGSAFGSLLTPSGETGELRNDSSGKAYRLEGNYAHGNFDGRGWWLKADREFFNPAASVSTGRTEIGLNARYNLTEAFTVYGLGQQTVDGIQVAEPKRSSAAFGVNWKVNERLRLDASLRHTKEDAGFGASSAIAGNATPGGGFFGNGTDATNPTTGTSVLPATGGNIVSTGLPNASLANATTIRLGAQYRVTDLWNVSGEVEGGTEGQSRYGLGSAYQINERSRAYARYEHTTGLTSAASLLNRADKSDSFVLGVDNSFANGPSVFSEFRMRDAIGAELAAARDQQLATGVRNTWHIREGLAYTASAEYLKIFSGTVQDAFAVAVGTDRTFGEFWKTSARLEYRQLFDDKSTVGIDDRQDQILSTVAVARKLSRDWTLLARNYLLYQNKHDLGSRLEDRIQIGAAWRPVDHNRWNVLSRYEYKTVRDAAGTTGAGNPGAENYQAHVVSMHGDYHPSRPWWLNGRLAAKTVTDKSLPLADRTYSAYLAGGRVVYDISKNWDVGALASVMWSPTGSATQKALGVEAGYLVYQNLWLSAGFNISGFSDRDLTGSDYTKKGFYIRLRYKFDETLFSSKNKDINRTIDR